MQMLTKILESLDKIQTFSCLPVTRRGRLKTEIQTTAFLKLYLSTIQYKQTEPKIPK